MFNALRNSLTQHLPKTKAYMPTTPERGVVPLDSISVMKSAQVLSVRCLNGEDPAWGRRTEIDSASWQAADDGVEIDTDTHNDAWRER